MNWGLANEIMEQKAIKTDVIASEDAYFMATHVPFNYLEVLRGGQDVVGGESGHQTEEEVYQNLVYNPENLHRLIVVRGNNGTGKSHLIRWLCTRFRHDSERYNPDSEKIIFLRRLSNTIRGAIKQILDENIIFDPEMREKLEKFVSSTNSMNEEQFKMNIYQQFILAVGSDSSDKVYSKGVRRDIKAFLADQRIEQHMFANGGPVDRCYKAITAPSNTVFEGEATFTVEDFTLDRRLKRDLKKNASMEAQTFMEELDDEESVEKLVKYLNGFTSRVVQGCAEISSESTKEVFLQLRRELKKQGKNLTIFIEDFTAFTGLDSELITVLAAEHGGENSDLCRVTSVIGITDDYYKQFRGNFTDRVQYQVNVNEGSYGSPEFLIEMTARYLNAMYCEPKAITNWFQEGGRAESLPVSNFFPEYEWDSVSVEGKKLTLYPFNKKAVLGLYDALYDENSSKGYRKTPRMFLLYVIKEQMTHFFDGMEYGIWKFPSEACVAAPVFLGHSGHDSAIDALEKIPVQDRRRIKLLLQFWGSGNAFATDTAIGEISKGFWQDVSLAGFSGFVSAQQPEKPVPPEKKSKESKTEVPPEEHRSSGDDEAAIIKGADVRALKNLRARISDINTWFGSNSGLEYSADLRQWFKLFILEAINWQAEGIPFYIAQRRLNATSAIYIEGQKEQTTRERALIKLGRTIEDKDLLTAITYRHYAKSWGFQGGVYFQIRVAGWLEKHRKQIMAQVAQSETGVTPQEMIDWCIGAEYLQAAFLGIKIPQDKTLEAARILLEKKSSKALEQERASDNEAWKDAIRYLNGREATYDECNEIFRESLRTTMGLDMSGTQTSVGFFRGEALLSAVERFQKNNWNVQNVDTYGNDTGIYKPALYSNALLSKISAAVAQEDVFAEAVLIKLKSYVGEITVKNIASMITTIQNFLGVLAQNNRPVSQDVWAKFNVEATEAAQKIVCTWNLVTKAMQEENIVNKLAMYSDDPLKVMVEFIRTLEVIERQTMLVQDAVKKERAKITGGKDIGVIKNRAITALKQAMGLLGSLEAHDVN